MRAGASQAAATRRPAATPATQETVASVAGTDTSLGDRVGAVVFGADFLIQLAAEAAPETFRPELFRLDPLDPADLSAIMVVQDAFTPEDLATRTKGAAPFRITRIAEFGP